MKDARVKELARAAGWRDTPTVRDARYCYQCGEPVRNFTRGTLDDLEAAIAAAVDGAA